MREREREKERERERERENICVCVFACVRAYAGVIREKHTAPDKLFSPFFNLLLFTTVLFK